MAGQEQRQRKHHDAAGRQLAVLRAAAQDHPLLAMQRLAGNAAVGALLQRSDHGTGSGGHDALALPVQRRLKVTGTARDVGAMKKMLEAAAGLTLVWDPKTKLISVKGPSGKKPLSKEVADRLRQIIGDTAKDAEIHLGTTRQGVHIGEFPTDFKDNPVQELRIDQILSLEKGAPGSGVSTLMHEIIENFEMHSHRNESFDDAFTASHGPAVKGENKILDEIQDSRGEPRSGARLNQYTVDVDSIPGMAPKGSGRNRPKSTGRVMFIEVHENDYLIFDRVLGRNDGGTARRVPAVPSGVFQIGGFTTSSKGVAATEQGKIAQIVTLLTKDPTASVIVRVSSAKETTNTMLHWQLQVQEAIRDQITDVIMASESRFQWNPPQTGPAGVVEVVVTHPKL